MGTSSSVGSALTVIRWDSWEGRGSVLGHHDVLVTPHLLQHGRQTVQIAVGEVLRLPKVQDHPRRTRLGGEVVEIPAERQIRREADE